MKSKLLGLVGLMLVSSTALADHRHLGTDAAIGGGLGGAVGGLLGAELGGRDAAIIGAGVGAMLGTSVSTQNYGYYPKRYHRVHNKHSYYKGRHYYEPRRYHHKKHYRKHNYKHGYRGGFCPPGHAKKGWCY